MDTKFLITDALGYTRETFLGKWSRGGTFILLLLPGLISALLFDQLCDCSVGQGDLVFLSFVLSAVVATIFFVPLMGYLARIYRGSTLLPEVPDFDNWGALFIDGFRITLTYILWFLPAFLLLLTISTLTHFLCTDLDWAIRAAMPLYLLLTPLLIATYVVGQLFSDFGAIRCARTNSVLEGLNISSIIQSIRTIGWVKYLMALIILIVPYFIITVAIDLILEPIPYIFNIINCCLIIPFYLVFASRYMTLLYNQGTPKQ